MRRIQAGIYAIRNRVTGREYVGQSRDIETRLKSHLYNLRNGTHHSKAMLADFVKHGEHSFDFFVLEPCPIQRGTSAWGNKYEAWADARERHWFDQLKPEYCTVAPIHPILLRAYTPS